MEGEVGLCHLLAGVGEVILGLFHVLGARGGVGLCHLMGGNDGLCYLVAGGRGELACATCSLGGGRELGCTTCWPGGGATGLHHLMSEEVMVCATYWVGVSLACATCWLGGEAHSLWARAGVFNDF